MQLSKRQARYETKPEKLSLYLTPNMAKQIADLADERLQSRNLFVNQILSDWFQKREEINNLEE